MKKILILFLFLLFIVNIKEEELGNPDNQYVTKPIQRCDILPEQPKEKT